MTSSKLVGVVLRVENPKHLAEWYKNTLGTSIENETSGSSWICEFGINSSSARIKLLQGFGTPYHTDKNSVYWKIGLALPDVRSARELILEKGHPAVSEPVQFLNIGYLCHLNDPEGFSIELLQHTFEENFIKSNVVLKPENILGKELISNVK